jgi:putative hydrolase of the HAD superfamily
MYAAVIFDLFGTLAPFSARAHDQVLSTMAALLHLPAHAFGQAWSAAYLAQEQGLAIEHALQLLCTGLGRSPTADLLAAAGQLYRDFQQRTLTPYPEAIPVLTVVRQMGYAIGLISNCPAIVADFWPASPLAPLIDVAIFSARVGLLKPNPQIYRLAYEQLGIAVERCLYVGDGGSRELSGAAACGMNAVQLQHDDEDQEDAQRLGRQQWSGTTIQRLSEILLLLSHTL